MKNALKQYPRSANILGWCLVAIVLGIITPLQLYKNVQPTAVVAQDNGGGPVENQPVTGELDKGTPEYDTVLPKGKTIKDYGGWTRVSPPNRNPVFAYADKIGETPINVSQQPLPKEFSQQPDEQIEQLARGYLATKKIKAGTVTAYIGTSAKGPQSVVLVKNNLLILIKASASVPDAEWQKYIQSLS